MSYTMVYFRHLRTQNDIRKQYTANHEVSELMPLKESYKSAVQTEIIKIFDKFNITKIYHSGNQRSLDSLDQMITPRVRQTLKIEADQNLRNIEQPEMEGLTFEEIRKRPVFPIWNTRPELAQFEDGENLNDVYKRCKAFRERVNENCFILSHTTPLQVLLCIELGIPISKIWCFKFDHLKFSLVHKNRLLRLNSEWVSDCDLGELVIVNN